MPPFAATHGIGTLPTFMPNDITYCYPKVHHRCPPTAKLTPCAVLQYKPLSKPKSNFAHVQCRYPWDLPLPPSCVYPRQASPRPSTTRLCTPRPLSIKANPKLHIETFAIEKTVILISNPTSKPVPLKTPSGPPGPRPDPRSRFPATAKPRRLVRQRSPRSCQVAGVPVQCHDRL